MVSFDCIQYGTIYSRIGETKQMISDIAVEYIAVAFTIVGVVWGIAWGSK